MSLPDFWLPSIVAPNHGTLLSNWSLGCSKAPKPLQNFMKKPSESSGWWWWIYRELAVLRVVDLTYFIQNGRFSPSIMGPFEQGAFFFEKVYSTIATISGNLMRNWKKIITSGTILQVKIWFVIQLKPHKTKGLFRVPGVFFKRARNWFKSLQKVGAPKTSCFNRFNLRFFFTPDIHEYFRTFIGFIGVISTPFITIGGPPWYPF